MSVVFNRVFQKYDSNGDGKINKTEFQKICYELGHYFSDDELEIAFGLVDSDGSGVIDNNEFLNFWRTDKRFDGLRLDDKQTLQMSQRVFLLWTHCLRLDELTLSIVGEYFRFFDKDGSGHLDASEFEKMCEHMVQGGYDLKRLNFTHESVDKDGNGFITFNEFIAKMIDIGVFDNADGTRPVHG